MLRDLTTICFGFMIWAHRAGGMTEVEAQCIYLINKKENDMSLAIDYNVHRTSVDVAKGYQQLDKASTAFSRDNVDSAANHLNNALNDFSAAVEHAAQAADDACTKAGNEIDKGNAELQKSINAYANNHPDKAQGYYDSAVKNYDKALDLIGG
jgi:hypothetical protein